MTADKLQTIPWERLVGLAFTNASPALPVFGGRSKFLGTNPFTTGAPTGESPPYVLDMACSSVARGKLKYAAQRGEAILQGLALDRQGRPTTDRAKAFEGVVLPMGGVKGSGLSLLMDVFESLVLEGDRAAVAFPSHFSGKRVSETAGPSG
jgi:LDH2 family malate/lactate/ureidoglycolate dehydrogenase